MSRMVITKHRPQAREPMSWAAGRLASEAVARRQDTRAGARLYYNRAAHSRSAAFSPVAGAQGRFDPSPALNEIASPARIGSGRVHGIGGKDGPVAATETGVPGVAADLDVRVLGEEDYPRWTTLIASAPAGGPYSHPDYLAALCAATDARFRVIVAERDGRIVGGIALYERASRAGSYVCPRYLLYYNGIVLVPHDSKYPSQQTSWNLQTLSAIERALTAQRYSRLRIKSRAEISDVRVFQSNGWSAHPGYSYVVDLSDMEAAWARVDKNQRRLIGRCREQGLTAETSDDFDAFYRLHEQTHERKGAALYLPYRAFRGYFEALRSKDLCRLYHARLPDGRVAATQIVLASGHPVTHTVSAAADAEFLNLGASAFLRWSVFEQLVRDGYKGNDLTDAALNPVTHFKSQLGGELRLHFELARPDHVLWRLSDGAAAASSRARGAVRRLIGPRRKPDA